MLTASELQERHGTLLSQPPYSEVDTPYLLHKGLQERDPAIQVSLKAVTVWWNKYKMPANAVTVASAHELEELDGDSIRHVAMENKTSYKLCRALRDREPPICVTDKLASAWLKKYASHSEVQNIENAGDFEKHYGDRIRSEPLKISQRTVCQRGS